MWWRKLEVSTLGYRATMGESGKGCKQTRRHGSDLRGSQMKKSPKSKLTSRLQRTRGPRLLGSRLLRRLSSQELCPCCSLGKLAPPWPMSSRRKQVKSRRHFSEVNLRPKTIRQPRSNDTQSRQTRPPNDTETRDADKKPDTQARYFRNKFDV